MEDHQQPGVKVRKNWFINLFLFLGGFISILSGIYFLYLPDGGYKGGRNPYYGIRILFEREGWEWLHTWISLGMIVFALIHLILHWNWVVNTTKKIFNRTKLGKANKKNVLVDVVLGISFLICSLSGVYLFVVPEVKGGLGVDPGFILSRTGWDMVHTWSGVVFTGSAILHFVFHWNWIVNITHRMLTRKTAAKFVQATLDR